MNSLNKKTLIQTAVVVLCFLGSGLVLYNGYFKKTLRPPALSTSDDELISANTAAGKAPVKNIEQILPNGRNLDFEILNRPNVQYGTTLWQNSVSDSEVGASENNLVVPKTIPAALGN